MGISIRSNQLLGSSPISLSLAEKGVVVLLLRKIYKYKYKYKYK